MIPRRRNPVVTGASSTTTTSSSSLPVSNGQHDSNILHDDNGDHKALTIGLTVDITNGNDNDNSNNNDNNDDSSSGGLATGGGSSSSSGGGESSSSNNKNGLSFSKKNSRLLLLIIIMGVASYYMSVKERKVLDEAHYEDARKQYFKDSLNHHERYSTTYQYHRPTGPSGQFVLQPLNEFLPHIAWLMSFPNSGTSYTMTMVARSSNKSHATNYGDEVTPADEPNSLSIYPRRPEGPFWPGMSGKLHTPRDLPDKYVITKTHCGSRCVDCGPDEYIETPLQFLKRCALGHARLTPAKQRRKYDVEYPPERVYKAIHLYRNPFHNIIARYHLEHRHKGYKNNTKWLKEHSNDSNGLHQWCKDLGKTYQKQDIQFYGSKDKIPKAPCHGEFYKWIQWHNLVYEGVDIIIDSHHDVPLHTVFYEDYTTKVNETALDILNFLELKQVSPFREFAARSDYDGYFTSKEIKQITSLIQSIAINRTWIDIQHYFVNPK
jgi:hypothetical protein